MGIRAERFWAEQRQACGAECAGGTGGSAAGKRPPQAKTQEEFAAYKAAVALTDPAAQEKAANDFAAKFPDSELRPVVYKS